MCVSGQENSGSFYGWSLHSLKGVVSEAGAHMADRLGLEDKSNGVGMAVSPSLCLCEDVLFVGLSVPLSLGNCPFFGFFVLLSL